MTTREERQAQFVQSVMGDQRKFPWPWFKTAEFIMGLRKGAQLEGDALAGQGIAEPQGSQEAENEDIVRGLLQVHQQQQQTVAAAEAEGQSLRQELDKSRQQLQSLFMQSQQQQTQMQQMQMQAQQAVQQARMQADQAQQMAAPEIQKAQQAAAMSQQQATEARIEKSKLEQLYEQTRRAVLDYKAGIMQQVAQDPVTMAEAQKMQQDQAMAARAQMQQQQQQQMQQAQQAQPPQQPQEQAPQQGGMVAQASGGQPKTAAAGGPVEQIARAVAGQGERAGYRRALAEQYLQAAAQQGAQAGQGGVRLPFDSLAAEVLKQGSAGEAAVKVAMDLNSVANDLRRLQGRGPRTPDSSVLVKVAQNTFGLNLGLNMPDWIPDTTADLYKSMQLGQYGAREAMPGGGASAAAAAPAPAAAAPAPAQGDNLNWFGQLVTGAGRGLEGLWDRFQQQYPLGAQPATQQAPAQATEAPAAPATAATPPVAPPSSTPSAAQPTDAEVQAQIDRNQNAAVQEQLSWMESPQGQQAMHQGGTTQQRAPAAPPAPAPDAPAPAAPSPPPKRQVAERTGGGQSPAASPEAVSEGREAVQRGFRNFRVGQGVQALPPSDVSKPSISRSNPFESPERQQKVQVEGASPRTSDIVLGGGDAAPAAQASAPQPPPEPPAGSSSAPDWAANRARTWISQHPGRAPTQQELMSTQGPMFPEQGGPVYR